MYLIETKALTKTYKGGVQALRGMDLQVPGGCCFGLLGPNGAGKSTLVKILLSIVRPTSGSATLRGIDIGKAEARRGVGYLPEGHKFPPYLTAEGVCRYFGALAGITGKELDRQVHEKLELVGLGDWKDTKLKGLSKGMAQRVGVAQALIGDPGIIFLDEPTDGVDPVARQGLRFVIRKVTEKGAVVFINSHLLSEIELLCDQVAIVDKGEILRQGTVSEIVAGVQGSKNLVKFHTDELPEVLWATLEERGAERKPDSRFVIEIQEDAEISGLIDELRAAAVMIYAVEPQRMNLEDAFIDLIGADRGLQVEKREVA